MKPIIGITAGEMINNGEVWAPLAFGQAHTYTDAVLRAGGVPFILPIIDDTAALRQLYDQCQALLLSGGNDIDPAMYGQQPASQTHHISPLRDMQERQLLIWALEDDKPVLGICRGMQLLNVTLGGDLYQDISEIARANGHRESQLKQSFDYIAHSLRIKPESKLYDILGMDTIPTNALHHQAVKDLGKDLVATAWADDGVIEAVELPTKRFVLAVQSHPEALEAATEPAWRRLFSAFVQSGAAS